MKKGIAFELIRLIQPGRQRRKYVRGGGGGESEVGRETGNRDKKS